MHGQTPKQVPYADLKVGQKYHVRYEAAGTSIDLTGTIAMKDDKKVLVILNNAGGKLVGESLKFYTTT